MLGRKAWNLMQESLGHYQSFRKHGQRGVGRTGRESGDGIFFRRHSRPSTESPNKVGRIRIPKQKGDVRYRPTALPDIFQGTLPANLVEKHLKGGPPSVKPPLEGTFMQAVHLGGHFKSRTLTEHQIGDRVSNGPYQLFFRVLR